MQATGIVWGGVHEPQAAAEADLVREVFRAAGLEAEEVDGDLLFPLERVHTRAGGPFRVFTPFWRACLALPDPALPEGPPPSVIPGPDVWPRRTTGRGAAVASGSRGDGSRRAGWRRTGNRERRARTRAWPPSSTKDWVATRGAGSPRPRRHLASLASPELRRDLGATCLARGRDPHEGVARGG